MRPPFAPAQPHCQPHCASTSNTLVARVRICPPPRACWLRHVHSIVSYLREPETQHSCAAPGVAGNCASATITTMLCVCTGESAPLPIRSIYSVNRSRDRGCPSFTDRGCLPKGAGALSRFTSLLWDWYTQVARSPAIACAESDCMRCTFVGKLKISACVACAPAAC